MELRRPTQVPPTHYSPVHCHWMNTCSNPSLRRVWLTRGSDLSGMRVWFELPDKPPKPSKVKADGEGNLEWIVEEGGIEYQLQSKTNWSGDWEAVVYRTYLPLIRPTRALDGLLPEHVWRRGSGWYRDGLWQTYRRVTQTPLPKGLTAQLLAPSGLVSAFESRSCSSWSSLWPMTEQGSGTRA